jgi:hypothetical protein
MISEEFKNTTPIDLIGSKECKRNGKDKDERQLRGQVTSAIAFGGTPINGTRRLCSGVLQNRLETRDDDGLYVQPIDPFREQMHDASNRGADDICFDVEAAKTSREARESSHRHGSSQT